MKEINETLSAILKSLVGLALILFGIILAAFGIIYIALPVGVIGFVVCLFSYLDLKIHREKPEDSSDDDNSES